MTIVLPLRTRRVRRRRDPPAPSDAPPSTTDRVPRVARMLALAHHWKGLIRSGIVKDQAALAALVGVTRARVTQVMGLLYLAPDIQEELLFLIASDAHADRIMHSAILPLAAQASWREQRRAWKLRRFREGQITPYRAWSGPGRRTVHFAPTSTVTSL